MILHITGFTLIALGLLTIIFFRHYTGDIIPYPFLFWIAGLLLVLAGVLIIRRSYLTVNSRFRHEENEMIQQLKMNGECIDVDFANCIIKEYHYSRESQLTGEIAMYNSIGGEGWRNTESTEVLQSVIVYTRKNVRTGEEERFISPAIPKDKITLSFYLDQQKTTRIYVNKQNRTQYYFDLAFLRP